jgi:hypothetical protein
VCTPPATDNPTIHLHINDPGECQSLYGGTDTTCWVYPTRVTPPPSTACNGNVACKSADIAEATGDFDASGYPIVPMFTQLHIKYTYLIVNQPGSGVTMSFNPPTSKTQDINSGGGKDYFGCEQSPDQTTGTPGSFSPPSFTNYAGPGFTLNFTAGTGTCNQSRFTLVASSTITLNPGDSRTFTIDMVTRQNKSKNYEYTSAGPHLLNSGFTVKWFQSGPSPACPAWKSTTTLCSYTTGVTPLYVDAQPSLSP